MQNLTDLEMKIIELEENAKAYENTKKTFIVSSFFTLGGLIMYIFVLTILGKSMTVPGCLLIICPVSLGSVAAIFSDKADACSRSIKRLKGEKDMAEAEVEVEVDKA